MKVELTNDEVNEINNLVSKKLKGILWVIQNKPVENKEALQKRAEIMKSLLDKLGYKAPAEQKQLT